MTMKLKKIQVDLEEPRVETGLVQFNDDWPGIFMRGDEAHHYAAALEALMSNRDNIITKAVIEGLIHTLQSCKLE